MTTFTTPLPTCIDIAHLDVYQPYFLEEGGKNQLYRRVSLPAVGIIDICALLDALTPGWASDRTAGSYERERALVQEWLAENDAAYYAADHEEFNLSSACYEAIDAGKTIVVVEDLS